MLVENNTLGDGKLQWAFDIFYTTGHCTKWMYSLGCLSSMKEKDYENLPVYYTSGKYQTGMGI